MMDYLLGRGEDKAWILGESSFSADHLGKSEAVMSLGNGYMGLRSAAEEPYIGDKRNLFINGTFNKAGQNEVTELPNAADATRLDLRTGEERFSLELGGNRNYIKKLNLKNAELDRSVEWESPNGKKLQLSFSRFVSFDHLHLVGIKMEVINLGEAFNFSVRSGIDAQMTNSGVQHFLEGERRIIAGRFIQLVQTTTESGIDIVHNCVHKLKVNGEEITGSPDKGMDRRKAWITYSIQLQPKDRLEMEKLVTVHTSRDKDISLQPYSLPQLQEKSLQEMKKLEETGYQKLIGFHRSAWRKKVWDISGFEVESDNPEDQLAIRFSLYHLNTMAPAHDDRMGIGAKALSGEAYKGHSFWDTEIFILPFFIWSNPETAKSLLVYRYHGLPGARGKAADNGYAGAMYPWEMAWPPDGEVTPDWGDIDIVTGERTKIWPGLIEHHISSDIAFAVHQYANVTGDKGFLSSYGYEMVFETANFWASRLEWEPGRQQYVITDVIGPDEYKEHVRNNAFTNYMAYFNMRLAMRYAEELQQRNPKLSSSLAPYINYDDWLWKSERLYLPEPRGEDLVIPQDDTYLDLPEVNLDKYRKQKKVRSIYRDYNAEQINGFQVTKQADTILLFYLMEQTFLKDDHRFSEQVKRANFSYYEARTLHDSSLSLVTHVIAANDLGERELAYSLFRKARETDMGPAMDSSDDGIHAAAIGGIWKAAIFGFAGVRQTEGRLRINPRMPKEWRRMKFSVYWQGLPLHLDITRQVLAVTSESGGKVQFETAGKLYEFSGTVEIPLRNNESGS